jgi:hypothetical protein
MEIAEFLKSHLPSIEVEVREDPFLHYRGRYHPESLARRLASIRIVDVVSGRLNCDPLMPEVEYELRRILDPSLKCHGVLYDGYELMALIADLIPVEERKRGRSTSSSPEGLWAPRSWARTGPMRGS